MSLRHLVGLLSVSLSPAFAAGVSIDLKQFVPTRATEVKLVQSEDGRVHRLTYRSPTAPPEVAIAQVAFSLLKNQAWYRCELRTEPWLHYRELTPDGGERAVSNFIEVWRNEGGLIIIVAYSRSPQTPSKAEGGQAVQVNHYSKLAEPEAEFVLNSLGVQPGGCIAGQSAQTGSQTGGRKRRQTGSGVELPPPAPALSAMP